MTQYSLFLERSPHPQVVAQLLSGRGIFARWDSSGRVEVLWSVSNARRVYDALVDALCPLALLEQGGETVDAWCNVDAFDLVAGWGALHAMVHLPNTSATNDNMNREQVRAASIALLAASIALAISHNAAHPFGRVRESSLGVACEMLQELARHPEVYSTECISEEAARLRVAIADAKKG